MRHLLRRSGFFLTLLLCIAIFASGIGNFAQSDPTPTVVGIVSIQGNDNMGNVQLLPMTDVISRTGILAWQQANWTGRGQRVGVLDQGFGDLEAFESAAGTPVTLAPGMNRADVAASPITHGTDVLTVINAIAPNADLFACQYFDFGGFVFCIDWMLGSGVNIINHSAGVPVLPLDGSGQWAREVDRAARAGVLWINAAGNFADGYINDFFSDNNLNTYHEFRGAGVIETLAINPIGQANGRIMLSWEGMDGLAANAIDLDLEVIDVANTIIAASTQPQTGLPGELALELVQVDMSQPFGVRIRNPAGNAEGVHFVLFIEFASLPGGLNQQSIISPGDSVNALTVGALQGNIVAPYSSRGPIATGAIKPDLVAPGEILLPNGRVFVGTSAAAPVVTGISALVWEANPQWTREQVYRFLLEAVQDDRDLPGADIYYGQGRIFLVAPAGSGVAIAAAPLPTNEPAIEPTAMPTLELAATLTPQSDTIEDDGIQPLCFVRTDESNVAIRVGPGTNRNIRSSMPVDTDVPVVGQAEASNGSLWWQIQPPGYSEAEADRYWVAQEQVTTSGNCASIALSSPSAVIRGTSPTSETVESTSDSLIEGVSCSTLNLVGPLTTVDSGNHTFQWTAAEGENLTYELVFYTTEGIQAETFRTTETSYFINLGQQTATGGEFSWEVRVFQAGAYACVSGRSPRIIRSDRPGGDGFWALIESCTTEADRTEAVIRWANAPAQDTVVLTATTGGGEALERSSSRSGGTFTIRAYGFQGLHNIHVNSSPSGGSVSLGSCVP